MAMLREYCPKCQNQDIPAGATCCPACGGKLAPLIDQAIRSKLPEKPISPLDPQSPIYQRFCRLASYSAGPLGFEVIYLSKHIKDKKLFKRICDLLLKVNRAYRMEYIEKIIKYYKQEKQ